MFRLRRLTVGQFHERVFDLFLKGRKRSLLVGEVEEFLDEWLEKRVDKGVLALGVGGRMILSSSPDFLVGPIARRLGIEEWAASEYAVDKEGVFCEISKIVDGELKREIALELAGGRRMHAYSDSEHDAPLLEEADIVVLVRPSARLRRMAKDKGWLKCKRA
ncbi:MAG: haloacid dehalogenase-like hydrolase [Chlamydiae bacterium]|nr:haloacid dehalogenase-like hydrolase [Chlamydiota bacterium]